MDCLLNLMNIMPLLWDLPVLNRCTLCQLDSTPDAMQEICCGRAVQWTESADGEGSSYWKSASRGIRLAMRQDHVRDASLGRSILFLPETRCTDQLVAAWFGLISQMLC
jgi:hypothetical protein